MYRALKDIITGKSFLETDKAGNPTDYRLRLAVVALLWEMARIDGEQDPEEFHEIIRSIDNEFQIMDEEAADLTATVNFLRENRKQFNAFLDDINNRFDAIQRVHLYEMIIRVAEADGEINISEKEFAVFLKEKLNLN